MNFHRRIAGLVSIAVFLAAASLRADPPCPFEVVTMSFKGTPLEQAKCLLRPVLIHGQLAQPLSTLPAPLEDIIGKPVTLTPQLLRAYLNSHGINETNVGGAVTNKLNAKYFVIHDTSTPNYHEQSFPTNINASSWSYNNLKHWAESSNAVAHCFVNRLGESVSPHSWITPWRATKLEVRVLGDKSKGTFVHTELIQPRRALPGGHPGNDAIAPMPGITDPQLERLALLYITASVQHGTWMIPGYHAAVDAGIPDGHDDPQNFDLALWAAHLGALIQTINAGTNSLR